ncbi:transcription factor kayak [Bactrocera dorsalis]|uniref:Transcription factor kayak n=1 Tax=Bactrocera dorsalis TaxID=27457 RepID=A0ABM3JB27_BACDO|nr:transcription factor kayak [Bactrocera dorsalis]
MRQYNYQQYSTGTNAQRQSMYQNVHNNSMQPLHQQRSHILSFGQQQPERQQQQKQQRQQKLDDFPDPQQLPMPTMSPLQQYSSYSWYQQSATQQHHQQTAPLQHRKHIHLQQQQDLARTPYATNSAALQQQHYNTAGIAMNAETNSNATISIPSSHQCTHATDYLSHVENNLNNNHGFYHKSNMLNKISNTNQLQQDQLQPSQTPNANNRRAQLQQQQQQQQRHLTHQQCTQCLQPQQQFQLQYEPQQQRVRQSGGNSSNDNNAPNNQQLLERILIEKSQRQLLQIPEAVTNNCSSFPVNLPSARGNSDECNINDVDRNIDSVNTAAECRFSMDAYEIANFLANELFMQQLVSVDGIQSGVPTLTTSTLTPTTLRSIEETFIQLTADHSNPPCQAGFIPPPVTSIQNSTSPIFSSAMQNYNEIDMDDSQASWNSQLHDDNSQATTDNSSASFPNGLNGTSNASLATSTTSSKNDFTMLHNAIGSDTGKHAGNLLLTNSPNSSNVHTSSSATNTTITATPTRRNQGGRRPAKPTNMSPEEEEKRRIRRERNKLAAARCRKRRVDQTNELQTEVERLENIRESLTKEIENLKVTKNQLAFILEAHRPTCQKVRQDLLSVHTYDGLIAPTNGNSNDSNSNIIGVDTTLSSVGRSGSPIDLKPVILDMVSHIKNEPLDNTLDSNSSLGHDGPPSPKRMLLSDNNPMVQPPLPNVSTLSASLAAASASLNTPIVTAAPVSFASLVSGNSISNNNSNNIVNSIAISNAITGNLSAPHRPILSGGKQRPNSLPTNLRNQAQNLALNTERPPTDINGVAIQTPSTGMFNFDSLMDGGTGLTPVSGPLVPNCSTQNKHPLEIQTPTSEPSKLVSL